MRGAGFEVKMWQMGGADVFKKKPAVGSMKTLVKKDMNKLSCRDLRNWAQRLNLRQGNTKQTMMDDLHDHFDGKPDDHETTMT